MKNVYLWKVGDRVIGHTDLEAAAQLDGLSRQPDMAVTIAEFEAAGSMARVIGDEIVIGKTPEEIAEEERQREDSNSIQTREKEQEELQVYLYLVDLDYRLLLLEWGITA